MTDWELLSRYRAGWEAAFSELVARHADWVYSAVNGFATVRIRFANPRGSVKGLDMAKVRRADPRATASQTYWLAPSRGDALPNVKPAKAERPDAKD